LAGSELDVEASLIVNEVEEHPLTSEESASRNIAWGRSLIFAFGGALFLLGAWRFVLAHRFHFSDALYCFLAILPAGLLLLVFDYVLHHARLVSIMVFIMAGILIFSFPVFDVALGLVLMGTIAGSALSDWRDGYRLRKSTKLHGNENEESK
jgi:hypothetical protein